MANITNLALGENAATSATARPSGAAVQGQNISEVAAEFSAKHVLSPAMAQKLHGLLREARRWLTSWNKQSDGKECGKTLKKQQKYRYMILV